MTVYERLGDFDDYAAARDLAYACVASPYCRLRPEELVLFSDDEPPDPQELIGHHLFKERDHKLPGAIAEEPEAAPPGENEQDYHKRFLAQAERAAGAGPARVHAAAGLHVPGKVSNAR